MNSSTPSKAQVWAEVLYRAVAFKQNGGLLVIRPAAESCGLGSSFEEELRRWLFCISPASKRLHTEDEMITHYLLLSDALRAGDLPTDPSKLDAEVIQEFTPAGAHRLRNTRTGECTRYASYQEFTYLDGVVGWTAYYGVSEGLGTPEDFMKLTAVGLEEKGTDDASN